VIYDGLRFGYVRDHGATYPLVEAEMCASRVEMLGMNAHIRATDARGETHEFFGTAIAAHPWSNSQPNRICYQSLYRYHDRDGRLGYGECGDTFGVEFLASRMVR